MSALRITDDPGGRTYTVRRDRPEWSLTTELRRVDPHGSAEHSEALRGLTRRRGGPLAWTVTVQVTAAAALSPAQRAQVAAAEQEKDAALRDALQTLQALLGDVRSDLCVIVRRPGDPHFAPKDYELTGRWVRGPQLTQALYHPGPAALGPYVAGLHALQGRPVARDLARQLGGALGSALRLALRTGDDPCGN